jgi:GTP-binding protein
VATKLDKLSRNEANRQLSLISKTLGIKSSSGIIIPFSSKTRAGREELWKLIDSKLN